MTGPDNINRYNGISDVDFINRSARYHRGGSDPETKNTEKEAVEDQPFARQEIVEFNPSENYTTDDFSTEYQSLENMGLLLN